MSPTVSSVDNPLSSPGIIEFLESILGAITYMAYPVLAFALIFAGFMFIAARGNKNKIKRATLNITYVFLAIAIVLGAYTIITLLYQTIIIDILKLT